MIVYLDADAALAAVEGAGRTEMLAGSAVAELVVAMLAVDGPKVYLL